jgi:hypothetical protein
VLSGYDATETSRVWHVVTGADDALIDGCTITGGHANGAFPDSYGAGLFADEDEVTVRNCVISGNDADGYGGGLFVDFDAGWGQRPVVENCRFENNTAYTGGGLATTIDASSSYLTVIGCVFVSNSASDRAGGLHNSSTATRVFDSVFTGNSANNGGGMYNFDSSPIIDNCVFRGNSAASYGGGIYNYDGGSATITNCSIVSNSAFDGGGISSTLNCSTNVRNSIIWGNGGAEIRNTYSSSTSVTYSDVQGGYTGVGNINVDPAFVSGTDLHLTAGSPCIDAADGDVAPELDIEGNPRVDVGTVTDTGTGDPTYVDMGAYEFQP